MSYKNQLPNESTSPRPAPSPQAYTLPGVISYLTSEFTNLERYKVVNNIEKSEMKFKIQLLVSEVNSLKFVNEKQVLRIKELEAELKAARSGQPSLPVVHPTSAITLQDIPPVDLQVLRDSRLRLNRTIKEALDLLKPPKAAQLLNDYNLDAQSDFERLLDESQNTPVLEPAKDSLPQKDSIFLHYALSSSDLPPVQKDSPPRETSTISKGPNAVVHSSVLSGEESEAETVIVDEPDVAQLLLFDEETPEQTLPPPDDSDT